MRVGVICTALGFTQSNGEAKRKIAEGAVKIVYRREAADYFASLGTADTQLSAEILQLMQSTSSSGQPMSAN